MSKLPTRPASKNAPAAPSPEKKEPTSSKSDDDMKGPVQRYYGRVARLAYLAKGLEEDFKQILDREPKDSKHFMQVKGASIVFGAVHSHLNNQLEVLTKLHDAKWVPAKVSKGPAAGSTVELKDFALARFTKHGAFSSEDLKGLKVISVHGNQLKIATKKGESLGIVSTGWVTKSEAA